METLDTDISGQNHDEWRYIWGKHEFSTKACYGYYFREVQSHPTFAWLWKAIIIPKLKVFGWLLLVDTLNTHNMLKQRHYNIGTNFHCLLCETHVGETVEHLFPLHIYP